jgi:hypothetical protein
VTQGQYVALAYGAAFVVVLVYVAIIATKLVRLQRETAALLELAQRRRQAETVAVSSPDPVRAGEA